MSQIKIKLVQGLLPLRDMSFSLSSVRRAEDTALLPEVAHALAKWIASVDSNHDKGVLIGGLAMSFYSKPRETQDADFLYLHPSDIPAEVAGFKRHRKGAFLESKYHVEIEVASPQDIALPQSVAEKVVHTSVVYGNLKVASLEGMITLKLFGSDTPRREYKDLADIVALIEHNPHVSMDEWSLSAGHQSKFQDAYRRATL